MVIPFILNRSLTTDCFKPLDLSKLQERTGLHRNQVANAIIRCWSIVAKCTTLAFKISMTNRDYEELDVNLKKERKALTLVNLLNFLNHIIYYVLIRLCQCSYFRILWAFRIFTLVTIYFDTQEHLELLQILRLEQRKWFTEFLKILFHIPIAKISN